jgi:hypothetical protein
MLNCLAERKPILRIARESLKAVQYWTKKCILRPIETIVKTVNGQAAHEELEAYLTDNEAVHAALVTRLLQAESRIRALAALTAVLAIAEVLHWIMR